MGDWRRPYEISWLALLSPILLVLVGVFFCFNGTPFEWASQGDWWPVLLNPLYGLVVLVGVFFVWLGWRSGVFVGGAGVMVRVEFRRIVVPWQEIAYAEVAEVPKWPVIWQRGPSLGLVLVAPSGQRQPLPVRLAAPTFRWGRGSPPYVVLSQEAMMQVVDSINEVAAGQRPSAWPPPGGWPFPRR